MRIRKIEIEWGAGKRVLDLRVQGGYPSPLVGILGNTGSGKTLLMRSVVTLFRKTKSNTVATAWNKLSGSVEFDLGSSICTGVIKNGVVTQNLVHSDTILDQRKYRDGLLIYDDKRVISGVISGEEFSVSSIRPVLFDLYKGDIHNSVIWVDNFDNGLDCSTARDFLQVLVTKSLEKDNQLIVSTSREEVLSIGQDSIRRLVDNKEKLVERVIKGF